jgi:hypothetical protein
VASESVGTGQDKGPCHGRPDQGTDGRGFASSAASTDVESRHLAAGYDDGIALTLALDRELSRVLGDQPPLESRLAGPGSQDADPGTLGNVRRLLGTKIHARRHSHDDQD